MDIQEKREAFEKLSEIAEILKNKTIKFVEKTNKYYSYHYSVEYLNGAWMAWQAKAQAVPEGFVLVPEGLTHEQAARISDDENFFETYQTILTESDTSEDSAVILIQTAHKAMIKAQEPAND